MRSVLPLLLLALLASCTDDPPPIAVDAGPPKPVEATLVPQRIPGTPIVISVPSDWKNERVFPPPIRRTAGDEVGPIRLQSRTLLSARGKGGAGAPWLMVLHDPALPLKTDATRYLDAQRASNRATHANLKHVDAERSRIEGRDVYRVRDSWSIDVSGKSVAFSQEALLILDATNPDERNGYAIVVTRREADRVAKPKLARELLDSVRFVD